MDANTVKLKQIEELANLESDAICETIVGQVELAAKMVGLDTDKTPLVVDWVITVRFED